MQTTVEELDKYIWSTFDQEMLKPGDPYGKVIYYTSS